MRAPRPIAVIRKRVRRALPFVALAAAPTVHASMFSGDTLDAVANVLAWIVLVVAPIIAISVFWLVHILPEQIAEKRHHPQAAAIKTLCLLSLVFGGMLWPLAWLWAYSKPVLYKMAYGKDTEPHPHTEPESQSQAVIVESAIDPAAPSETEIPVVTEPVHVEPRPEARRAF
jgi:CBS domain containing-hemolysin-like protein